MFRLFRLVKSRLKCLPKPHSGRPRRNQPFRENLARAFVGIPTCFWDGLLYSPPKVLPLKESLSILIVSHLRDVSGEDEKRKNIKPRFSFIADDLLLSLHYFTWRSPRGLSLSSIGVNAYAEQAGSITNIYQCWQSSKKGTDKLSTFFLCLLKDSWLLHRCISKKRVAERSFFIPLDKCNIQN